MSNILTPTQITLLEDISTFDNSVAAYQYLVIAEEKAILNNDQSQLALIRLSLTKILLENGAYKEGLIKVTAALEYYTTSVDLEKEASCWRYMAIIYGFLGNRVKQQAYNQKCLQITQQLNCPISEIKILNNIGHTYFELGKPEKAIAIFEPNLTIKNITPDLLTVTLKNLAMAYLELKAYDKAESYCQKARVAANKYHLLKYLTACDYIIARIYLAQGFKKKALPFFKKAVETLTEKGSLKKELLLMSEWHLKALTQIGPLEEITYYTQKYIALSKKLHKAAKDQTIKSLQFQFEINEIEKERLLLVEENEALQKANKKIEHQQLALIAKSTQLEAVNVELREFAHRIAHDLKQPIRSVNGFIALLKREIGNKLTAKGEKYIHYVTASTEDMTKFVDDLLIYAKSDQNSQPRESVDCNHVITQIKSQLAQQLQETNATLVVADLPTIEAHPSLILQVFQNLISNALKFHQPNTPPIIKIYSSNHPTHYVFSIKDNGIGIEKRHQQKVFQLFAQLNNKSEYEGSGIGLSTVVKVLRRYNATINLESTYGHGTTFNIIFPKATNIT